MGIVSIILHKQFLACSNHHIYRIHINFIINMSSNFKPVDSKREEFRKYLETNGVVDALTKVLVSLYEEPEKARDSLDYIQKNIGVAGPDAVNIEVYKQENAELQAKVAQLSEENKELKLKLSQFEANTEPKAA